MDTKDSNCLAVFFYGFIQSLDLHTLAVDENGDASMTEIDLAAQAPGLIAELEVALAAAYEGDTELRAIVFSVLEVLGCQVRGEDYHMFCPA